MVLAGRVLCVMMASVSGHVILERFYDPIPEPDQMRWRDRLHRAEASSGGAGASTVAESDCDKLASRCGVARHAASRNKTFVAVARGVHFVRDSVRREGNFCPCAQVEYMNRIRLNLRSCESQVLYCVFVTFQYCTKYSERLLVQIFMYVVPSGVDRVLVIRVRSKKS